jgi:hypothetical protein
MKIFPATHAFRKETVLEKYGRNILMEKTL